MRGMLGLLSLCIFDRFAGRDQLRVILDLSHVCLELLTLSIRQAGPSTVMMMGSFLPPPSAGVDSLKGVGGWWWCILILSLQCRKGAKCYDAQREQTDKDLVWGIG